jgi:hypothetical protein
MDWHRLSAVVFWDLLKIPQPERIVHSYAIVAHDKNNWLYIFVILR